MKQWTQGVFITTVALSFSCMLFYRAHDQLQTRQGLDAQSIIMYESSAESKDIMVRLAAKARIADELIAGRTSLLQAAAAFRDLEDRWPRVVEPLAAFPNVASLDEVYCRKVIGYAERQARPEQASELTRRLHAELDAVRRRGTLYWPKADDASTSD